LLLRRDHDIQQIDAGGLPIGIDAGARYAHVDIWLQPEDSLLLYSDGLLDCENHHGDHYGIEPVRDRAESFTGSKLIEFLSQLEKDLDEWRGGTPLSDDLSLLLLNFNPHNVSPSHVNEELALCQKP